ncbi:MAG: response regulator [Phycisphaerales bacterium]|nr:response regulator [Phycisphaerales bacterium]
MNPEPNAPSTPGDGGVAPPPLSIVALDDDPDFREYIRGVLTAEGHDVRVVSTPDELFAANDDRLPDIVLLDIKMGRWSGEEVLAGIRERWPRLCVIVVTGYPSLETMRQTFKLDVFDYLSKPFAIGDLRASIAQAAAAFDLGRRPQDRLRAVLGRRIRAERIRKDMTLKQFSEACGISASQLSSIERSSHLPSLETLLSIASALDARPSDWLEESGF